MGKDLGDKVLEDTNWPADEGVKGHMRYEIRITDPVTMDSAFVYIYHSSGLDKKTNQEAIALLINNTFKEIDHA
jgi:hypothetical protein